MQVLRLACAPREDPHGRHASRSWLAARPLLFPLPSSSGDGHSSLQGLPVCRRSLVSRPGVDGRGLWGHAHVAPFDGDFGLVGFAHHQSAQERQKKAERPLPLHHLEHLEGAKPTHLRWNSPHAPRGCSYCLRRHQAKVPGLWPGTCGNRYWLISAIVRFFLGVFVRFLF